MKTQQFNCALEPSPIHKDEKYLKQLREKYLALLKRPSLSEQQLQDFLEEHSELIPAPWMLNHGVHFDVVISKFPLDTALKSDLAYLTKSTVEWYLTLIELEHPSRRIFTENRKVATLSSEFNAALGQIASWRSFVERHGDEVKRRLEPLLGRGRLRSNRLRFRFVLVCGRNAEFESNQERTDRFALLNDGELKVLTYDSLVRGALTRAADRKNILTLSKNSFKLKYLNCYPGSLFAYLSPQQLEISPKQKSSLITDGFQIDKWLKGAPLKYSQRYADLESLMESEPIKALLSKHRNSRRRTDTT